jgi:hypothetical protein
MAHTIVQSEPNTKANEFLFRRLTVEDAAESHVVALAKAPALGFETFIISAKTPFSPDDCEELIVDAPSVVTRYFPEFPVLYARAGWTMFQSIDRVYDSAKARDDSPFNAASALKKSSRNYKGCSIARRPKQTRDGRPRVIARCKPPLHFVSRAAPSAE